MAAGEPAEGAEERLDVSYYNAQCTDSLQGAPWPGGPPI